MKKLCSVVAVSSLILAAGVSAAAAAPARTCLDNLNGHRHACFMKSNVNSEPTAVAVTFEDGKLSGPQAFSLTCSCGNGGTFNAPKFSVSPTKWICVGAGLVEDTILGVTIQGTVNKAGKITKVTAADTDGTSYVVNCSLDDGPPTLSDDDE